MEQKRSQITASHKEIEELQQELDRNLTELGRVISPHMSPKEVPQEGTVEQIRSLQGEIERVDQLISEINQANMGARSSSEEISQIEQRLASIEYEKNSLYSRIGVIAYEEYTAGEAKEEFSLIFASVLHQNARLTKAQKSLKDIELRYVAASVFERMTLRMRQKKIRREIEQLNKEREQLFRDAGKQICTTKLIRDIKSKTAGTIAAEYERLEKAYEALYKQLEEKKHDRSKNEEILSHAGVANNLEKRIEELKESKSVNEENLNRLYAELGAYVLDRPEIYQKKEIPELERTLKEIASCREQIEHRQYRVKQLEAEIKVEELRQFIERDNQAIERKHAQISSLEKEIEEIKKRVSQNSEKIEELKQIIKTETGTS